MRRLVKGFFGERVKTKRNRYMDVGFKAYENTFGDDAKRCHCTMRHKEREHRRAETARRGGLFN